MPGTKRKARLIEVHSESEIPAFATESEEQEFWATHSLGPELLEQFGPPDDQFLKLAGLRRLELVLDEDVAAKFEALAAAQGLEPERLAARLLAAAVAAEAANRG